MIAHVRCLAKQRIAESTDSREGSSANAQVWWMSLLLIAHVLDSRLEDNVRLVKR
jgi:hypothetical protein